MAVFRANWALLWSKANHKNGRSPDAAARRRVFLQSTFAWFAFYLYRVFSARSQPSLGAHPFE
jgi:hypothetical protein